MDKTETFIIKAKKKHGDAYDYSKVDYINAKTKICIICPKHGEFWQTPNDHLSGCGCKMCANERRTGNRKLTISSFIKRANTIHKNKYDYSKVVYKGIYNPVLIICPIHGEFTQIPNTHLSGKGCPKCGIETNALNRKSIFTKNVLLQEAEMIHGTKYNYTKTILNGKKKPFIVTCPIHGDFQKDYYHFIKRQQGCPKCGAIKRWDTRGRMTQDEFVLKANKIHDNKYTYDVSNYVSLQKKLNVTCPTHGDFLQTPQKHLQGQGCPLCKLAVISEKNSSNTQEFISKAQEIHRGKYSYEKTFYKNNTTPVTITCPIHGDFQQTPQSHLAGKGCKYCKSSHLELLVKKILDTEHISYINGYKSRWLGLQHLDFYLPEYKIGIECQGEQHFVPVNFAGKGLEWSKEQLQKVIERDKLKAIKCKEQNIKLLYFSLKKMLKYDNNLITTKEKLLESIFDR